jgi:hypothetical protein
MVAAYLIPPALGYNNPSDKRQFRKLQRHASPVILKSVQPMEVLYQESLRYFASGDAALKEAPI